MEEGDEHYGKRINRLKRVEVLDVWSVKEGCLGRTVLSRQTTWYISGVQ